MEDRDKFYDYNDYENPIETIQTVCISFGIVTINEENGTTLNEEDIKDIKASLDEIFENLSDANYTKSNGYEIIKNDFGEDVEFSNEFIYEYDVTAEFGLNDDENHINVTDQERSNIIEYLYQIFSKYGLKIEYVSVDDIDIDYR